MLAKLNKQIIQARKNRDKFSAGALNLIKAELQNNGKLEKPKSELEVVKAYAKKLQKSLTAFKGSDKYNDLNEEIKLIKSLLPKELSETEIRLFANKYLKDNSSVVHMGKIIGGLKSQLPNADGGLIAKVVKSILVNN